MPFKLAGAFGEAYLRITSLLAGNDVDFTDFRKVWQTCFYKRCKLLESNVLPAQSTKLANVARSRREANARLAVNH